MSGTKRGWCEKSASISTTASAPMSRARTKPARPAAPRPRSSVRCRRKSRGSRGVAGGHDAERTAFRRLLTVAANAYIRLVLGIAVRDCNSGFRCWRASTLRAIRVEETFSKGPAIVQELLFKTARAKIGIAEIPIDFVDRARGTSTLSMRTLMQGYTTVLKLRWMALRGRL